VLYHFPSVQGLSCRKSETYWSSQLCQHTSENFSIVLISSKNVGSFVKWRPDGGEEALQGSETGPDWTGPGYKLPASRGLLNSKLPLLLLLFIRKVMEI
jgi:hypothetical protein